MGIFDILLICIGLSMDNMAVAVAASCSKKDYSANTSLKTALIFCLTGFVCLLGGWYGAFYLAKYISAWDHWLSFLILSYIGGKMLLASLKEQQNNPSSYNLTETKTLIILALATNIDVFAVGLTLSLYKTSLLMPLVLLCVCIIFFTLLGFYMGKKMGLIFGKKAELAGGLILIIIGIKILIQGLLS